MANELKAVINKLSHDGRGITQINGKTTFIDNALPGEEVIFRYNKRHSKYDEAVATEILQASPQRVTAKCQHFGVCGGCAMQHIAPSMQIELKQQMLLEQLQHFGSIQPQNILPPLLGPIWGYRRKARLGAKFVEKKNSVLVGFREKNGRYLADLTGCEVLHPAVGLLIPDLKKLIASLQRFKDIPQIEVAITETETGLIFRHLQDFSSDDKNQLIQFAQQHQLKIYLQPAGPESVHLLYPADATHSMNYKLPAYGLSFDFLPNDFTQINSDINQQMIAQALELLALEKTDQVLDLFCGLGNFTLPISQLAHSVVGIEGDDALIKRAQHNAILNQVNNVRFYQANLAQEMDLQKFAIEKFNKILLDPPRTGAIEIIPAVAKLGAKRIVYVSCNPATLARDAGELTKHKYQLTHAGIMDMFPHTHHAEAMALFVKK